MQTEELTNPRKAKDLVELHWVLRDAISSIECLKLFIHSYIQSSGCNSEGIEENATFKQVNNNLNDLYKTKEKITKELQELF